MASNFFSRFMGYLGLDLVMLGIWDHCIRKEQLSTTDAQTTAVITSIYDNTLAPPGAEIIA